MASSYNSNMGRSSNFPAAFRGRSTGAAAAGGGPRARPAWEVREEEQRKAKQAAEQQKREGMVMNDLNFPSLAGGGVWGGAAGGAVGGAMKGGVSFATLATAWQEKDTIEAAVREKERKRAEREEYERQQMGRLNYQQRYSDYDRGSRWDEEDGGYDGGYDGEYYAHGDGEEDGYEYERQTFAQDREGEEESGDRHYHSSREFGACSGGECGGYNGAEEEDDETGWNTVSRRKTAKPRDRPRVFVAAEPANENDEEGDEPVHGGERDSIW
jgi:hypothetical protein